MNKDMLKHYSRLTYIVWDDWYDEEAEAQARQAAERSGWEYVLYPGSKRLLENMLWGRWDDDDFLVVQPGQSIAESWDEKVLKAV